jgi:hypothetical protein
MFVSQKIRFSVAVLVLGLAVLAYAAPASKPSASSGPAASQPASQPAAALSKSPFANVRCPIMGSKIDPTKVPPALVREYKGQKIAFCCAMCPPRWDKLTPEQKDAKLKAAMQPN